MGRLWDGNRIYSSVVKQRSWHHSPDSLTYSRTPSFRHTSSVFEARARLEHSMSSTRDSLVPRLVVVDDTDPTIQYSPASAFTLDSTGKLDSIGYGGPVFNQTITGRTTAASFSYKFNGECAFFIRFTFRAHRYFS